MSGYKPTYLQARTDPRMASGDTAKRARQERNSASHLENQEWNGLVRERSSERPALQNITSSAILNQTTMSGRKNHGYQPTYLQKPPLHSQPSGSSGYNPSFGNESISDWRSGSGENKSHSTNTRNENSGKSLGSSAEKSRPIPQIDFGEPCQQPNSQGNERVSVGSACEVEVERESHRAGELERMSQRKAPFHRENGEKRNSSLAVSAFELDVNQEVQVITERISKDLLAFEEKKLPPIESSRFIGEEEYSRMSLEQLRELIGKNYNMIQGLQSNLGEAEQKHKESLNEFKTKIAESLQKNIAEICQKKLKEKLIAQQKAFECEFQNIKEEVSMLKSKKNHLEKESNANQINSSKFQEEKAALSEKLSLKEKEKKSLEKTQKDLKQLEEENKALLKRLSDIEEKSAVLKAKWEQINSQKLYEFRLELEKQMREEMSIKALDVAAQVAMDSQNEALRKLSVQFTGMKEKVKQATKARVRLEAKIKNGPKQQIVGLVDETFVREEIEVLEEKMKQVMSQCASEREKNEKIKREIAKSKEASGSNGAVLDEKEEIAKYQKIIEEYQEKIMRAMDENAELNEKLAEKFNKAHNK